MYDRFYYNTTPLDAIAQAISQSKTEYAWVLFSAVDYSNFDFSLII
jgi:molybdopterin-guanine dinucleotide biosynthesis protein A